MRGKQGRADYLNFPTDEEEKAAQTELLKRSTA
jgi:hypothetical protein